MISARLRSTSRWQPPPPTAARRLHCLCICVAVSGSGRAAVNAEHKQPYGRGRWLMANNGTQHAEEPAKVTARKSATLCDGNATLRDGEGGGENRRASRRSAIFRSKRCGRHRRTA